MVTGCMAERYGDELAEALPEADAVVGFGVPGRPLGRRPGRRSTATGPRPLDLLDLLDAPAGVRPLGVREGGRGLRPGLRVLRHPQLPGQAAQPHRSTRVLAEVDGLADGGVREVVLVAQDLAAYGRDQGRGERRIVPLVGEVARRVDRVRLLYLYPSDLTDRLIDAICATGVPYFDLSLQHASPPLLRRMRRWGDGDRFLRRIDAIRRPRARGRVPVELHRRLPGRDRGRPRHAARLRRAPQLDWAGFFAYSREHGHLRRRPRRRRRPRAGGRPAGRAARAAGRHHRRRPRRAHRPGRRGARRRARRGPQPPRGARDRRHRRRARRRWRWASWSRCRSSGRPAPTSTPRPV